MSAPAAATKPTGSKGPAPAAEIPRSLSVFTLAVLGGPQNRAALGPAIPLENQHEGTPTGVRGLRKAKSETGLRIDTSKRRVSGAGESSNFGSSSTGIDWAMITAGPAPPSSESFAQERGEGAGRPYRSDSISSIHMLSRESSPMDEGFTVTKVTEIEDALGLKGRPNKKENAPVTAARNGNNITVLGSHVLRLMGECGELSSKIEVEVQGRKVQSAGLRAVVERIQQSLNIGTEGATLIRWDLETTGQVLDQDQFRNLDERLRSVEAKMLSWSPVLDAMMTRVKDLENAERDLSDRISELKQAVTIANDANIKAMSSQLAELREMVGAATDAAFGARDIAEDTKMKAAKERADMNELMNGVQRTLRLSSSTPLATLPSSSTPLATLPMASTPSGASSGFHPQANTRYLTGPFSNSIDNRAGKRSAPELMDAPAAKQPVRSFSDYPFSTFFAPAPSLPQGKTAKRLWDDLCADFMPSMERDVWCDMVKSGPEGLLTLKVAFRSSSMAEWAVDMWNSIERGHLRSMRATLGVQTSSRTDWVADGLPRGF
ncbi:hypothetical protein C8J56DRAFT_1055131 [Mycena floridula]|nr:hypothetical protein C8J56DRAFT_1055131 [Mycena floridula]